MRSIVIALCLVLGVAAVMGNEYGHGYGSSYGSGYDSYGSGYNAYSGMGGYSMGSMGYGGYGSGYGHGYGHGYGKRASRSRTVVVPVPVGVQQPGSAGPIAGVPGIGASELIGLDHESQNTGLFGGDGTGLLCKYFFCIK